MPASTSSAITPQPPGKDSILRTPNGLAISKNRNKTNPIVIVQRLNGINKRLMHIPATSSTTTLLLSLPQSRSTTLPLQIPLITIMSVAITKPNCVIMPKCQPPYKQRQQASAATVPPPLIYPIPNVDAHILCTSNPKEPASSKSTPGPLPASPNGGGAKP
jgi:hypothetical protein